MYSTRHHLFEGLFILSLALLFLMVVMRRWCDDSVMGDVMKSMTAVWTRAEISCAQEAVLCILTILFCLGLERIGCGPSVSRCIVATSARCSACTCIYIIVNGGPLFLVFLVRFVGRRYLLLVYHQKPSRFSCVFHIFLVIYIVHEICMCVRLCAWDIGYVSACLASLPAASFSIGS